MISIAEWEAIIQRLVDEGKRVGKAPWCCDGFAEHEAAIRLEYGHGITGQETMEETVNRREQAMRN